MQSQHIAAVNWRRAAAADAAALPLRGSLRQRRPFISSASVLSPACRGSSSVGTEALLANSLTPMGRSIGPIFFRV